MSPRPACDARRASPGPGRRCCPRAAPVGRCSGSTPAHRRDRHRPTTGFLPSRAPLAQCWAPGGSPSQGTSSTGRSTTRATVTSSRSCGSSRISRATHSCSTRSAENAGREPRSVQVWARVSRWCTARVHFIGTRLPVPARGGPPRARRLTSPPARGCRAGPGRGPCTASVVADRACREARTSGSVGLQDGALLVERGEGLREVEEVGAQPVRLEAVADLRHHGPEPQQGQGQRPFGRVAQDRPGRRSAPAPGVVPALRNTDRIRATTYCR